MKLKSDSGFLGIDVVVVVAAICAWVGLVFGWVWNIVKLVDMIPSDFTAMLVLRCIGIFMAPLGAVLGFC